MDYLNLNNNICRICLDQNVFLSWNEELNEFDNVTYKDCYYKYTHLEILVKDPYTQMLCPSCANGLEATHMLITKALESYDNLQQAYSNVNQTTDQHTNSQNGIYVTKCEPNEFELLLLQDMEEPFMKTDDDEKDITTLPLTTTREGNINKRKLNRRKAKRKSNKKPLKNLRKIQKLRVNVQSKKASTNKSVESQDVPSSKENIKKNRAPSLKKLCSICSQLCKNKRSLEIHEESHKERERSEVCPYCSIKFFNKACLQTHLKVHNKERKKYDCEFCDKSYLDRGTLNVHRRVHLGKMIPCSICSKEFYRQSELDRHNTVAHSAAPANADAKERSKYYVSCKYCNKQLLSTSYKGHIATHEQDPLMKCSLCDKDFFKRDTCRYHMQKVHNYKARQEYEQFIIYHKPNRLSHLLLKQHEIIAT